ncbi:hypothetical protein WJX81_003701 [Elliptochloris bilobata]|uniref:Secreted protein n=1 Tax=Elliptochloris bilobata TaxID=381761 RepID=A0AAW1RNY5_9CHLO
MNTVAALVRRGQQHLFLNNRLLWATVLAHCASPYSISDWMASTRKRSARPEAGSCVGVNESPARVAHVCQNDHQTQALHNFQATMWVTWHHSIRNLTAGRKGGWLEALAALST